MSVAEKVGQLFMTSFYGAVPADPSSTATSANAALAGVSTAAEMIDRYHLGGVIYMSSTGNLENRRQIAALSNGLQRRATRSRRGVPLLVATDQEGGSVSRVRAPVTQFPGNMALGADGLEEDAAAAAAASGVELRALGINMVLAPVADVNADPANPVIGVRSFGGDPHQVAALTYDAVLGYRSAGIASTAKHFPVMGIPTWTVTLGCQSSLVLPSVCGVSTAAVRAAIEAGVDAVMVGHLAAPSLDSSGRPASLSHDITTEWLRRKLASRAS
jgi:beta-N-acetylhexosaminidase